MERVAARHDEMAVFAFDPDEDAAKRERETKELIDRWMAGDIAPTGGHAPRHGEGGRP